MQKSRRKYTPSSSYLGEGEEGLGGPFTVNIVNFYIV